MTSEQFGKTYLQHEQDIANVLRKQRIYDEDLLHDTYIALYEHSQHEEINDFVSTFVSFYRSRYKRRDAYEENYECYDHSQLLNFDKPDESDLAYREQVGRRVDSLIRYFAEHPQPGERNHKRTCKILRLYCQGLNECEISNKLKISQQAVSQTLQRAIERLKLVAKRLYNRGPRVRKATAQNCAQRTKR